MVAAHVLTHPIDATLETISEQILEILDPLPNLLREGDPARDLVANLSPLVVSLISCLRRRGELPLPAPLQGLVSRIQQLLAECELSATKWTLSVAPKIESLARAKYVKRAYQSRFSRR